MGNHLAPNTKHRAKNQAQVRQETQKYMADYDVSRTGTLSREEVRALASDLLTQYTPQVGGITDEDVDLIMSVGGSNVQCEITAEQLPNAIAVVALVREQNRYFVELFDKYDSDSTGALPVEQLGALLAELNEGVAVCPTDVTYVLKQCEPRGKDEPIGKSQLKAAVACWYCLEPGVKDTIKELFKRWDKAQTGYISQEEMADVFSRLDKRITADKVALIYASVDTNNNGRIEYDEFVDWVMEGGISVAGVDQELKPRLSAPGEDAGAQQVSLAPGAPPQEAAPSALAPAPDVEAPA